jgi:heat shock protein beta
MLRKMAQSSKKDEDEDDEKKEGDDGEAKKEDKDEEEDKYMAFWKEFGKNLKLGLIEDSSNRTKLSKLLRFQTSKSEGKFISLEEYVENMKDWQKDIYYISGESMEAVEKSAFLEKCKKKDVEVIFLTDPIDEYAIQNLTEFDGKKMQSVTKDGLAFGDEDADLVSKREAIYKDNFKPLTDALKDVYGDKVEKITISQRVEDSPSVMVTSKYGYSANMERIMKAQAFADNKQAQYLVSKKTMEINPRHPIVVELNKLAKEDAKSEKVADLGWLLYDTASSVSGFQLDDPAAFAKRMYRLMQSGLNLESLQLADEVEVPKEEEKADEGEEEEGDDEEGEETDSEEGEAAADNKKEEL